MADTPVSKTGDGNIMRVRVSPAALLLRKHLNEGQGKPWPVFLQRAGQAPAKLFESFENMKV